MGNKGNEFIIRVIGEHNATLFGQSFRGAKKPDKIYHLIKTVLPLGGFVKELRREYGRKMSAEEARVLASRPNLYVSNTPKTHGFFTISPVAARQYEKINPSQINERKYEFHRVHPLYKNGLDLRNFGWVKWCSDGRVELNVNPEEGWYGRSYWALEETVSKDDEREMSSHYHTSLQKYNVRHFR